MNFAIGRRPLSGLCIFLACFCLFGHFAWADGDQNGPYIELVEAPQIEKGDSRQSPVIKLKLEPSSKKMVDNFPQIEISDSSREVYRVIGPDFHSVDSGAFHMMEAAFSLDSEIDATMCDFEGIKYTFVSPSTGGTLQSTPYDGIWTGTTDQGYELRFLVSNNMVIQLSMGKKLTGSDCTKEITSRLGGRYPISGNSFTIHLSGTATNVYENIYTCTFISNNECVGTWEATFDSLFGCDNATGSATWEADKTPFSVPEETALSVKTSGTNVAVSWPPVATAIGYTIFYAPYPYTGPESIGSVDMETKTGASFDLWKGAGFYLAVQAYNSSGSSGYSNIEHLIIGSKISVMPSTLSLLAGETGACIINGGTSPYSATSSNTSAATVSVSGSTISVTGMSMGSATITVTDDSGDQATVFVVVSEIAGKWTFNYRSYTNHYDIRADGTIYDLDYSFYSPTIGNKGYTLYRDYKYYVYGGLGMVIDRHFFFNYYPQTDTLEGIYVQTDFGGNPFEASGEPVPMSGDRYYSD